jgi:thiol-disulfide isomerase/thioredoxin
LNACGIATVGVYGVFRFGRPGKEVKFSMQHFFHIAVLFLLIVSSNTTADSTFDPTEYKGKVVLLDFWASWCVPCRRSFPWMNGMQEKYGDDGLVIIGVNLDSESADRDKFLQEYPAQFQIINDPGGELARAHDVVAMPSSYIYGRDSELVTRHLGFKVKRQDEYEAILVESLSTDQEKH